MKKTPLIISVMILAAMITGCGNEDKGSGTGHQYKAVLNGNPSSLDPQFADDPSSNTVIKNLYSGIMRVDAGGNIVCCNAESYTVSTDGTVYTFNLRDDNFWFFDTNDNDVIEEDEYFPVTAADYVFALRRVLDPKMKSPYAQDFSCVKGAELVERGLIPPSDAEIYAADDRTLVIVLDEPNTEFLYLMSTPAAYPCNEEFFDSTKGRYGLDDRSVMSNGAFFVRQWFFDPYGNNNILYMKRNDADWSETYDINPALLSFSIEWNEEDIRAQFKADNTECFTTSNRNPYNPKKYIVDGTSATTLGLIFNPEDRYFSNENLRKAIALGVDREKMAKGLNSDLKVAYGIIPPAVNLSGRSYRELVSDRSFDLFDREEAQSCFTQGKNEVGVETLEAVKVLVCGGTVDTSALHILTQDWQSIFGTYIGIDEVTEEEYSKRIESGDYSIALYPLKGELGYGTSVIAQFERVPCLQYVADGEELTSVLRKCSDTNALVEAYTSAERGIIERYGFIPVFYKKSYLIANKDNEQIYYDPFTEAVDFRLALNYS
ncbi:MAG: peptide ABC transporter substrate-binding protein [Ruminococcus sp.]|nr:peptide ABC transporter substrate-binding protein [Ruminococcus sp.]